MPGDEMAEADDASAPQSTSPNLPQPGDLLSNKYKIERLIGKGGMGAVFAAHHELLCQRVALKVVLGDLVEASDRTRFLNEARAAFRIKSEHVGRVLDVDFLESGNPFMVLEYLEGRDLHRVQKDLGALPARLVADYVIQALDALAQAHALGIVHRDLKPANLFLVETPGVAPHIKVLDFGISKSLAPLGPRPDSLTVTKGLLGTPMYMSPEQLRSSRSVDMRCDIWAIGVIMFELLTNTRPYEGRDVGELFAAILEQEPPRLSSRLPSVAPELDAIVARCLQRELRARYQNVAELARDLEPLASPSSRPLVARIQVAARGLRAHDSSPSLPDTTLLGNATTLADTPPRPSPRPSPSPSLAPPPKGRSGVLVIGASAVLVTAAIAAGIYAVRAKPAAPPPLVASATVSASAPPTAAPTASQPLPIPSAAVSAAPSATPSIAVKSVPTTRHVKVTPSSPPPPPPPTATPTAPPTFDPTGARKP